MNSEGKKSSDSSAPSTDWKLKINDLVQTCQTEIKKTTKIGMKMLSASQSSAQLHETYEDLGKWLVSEIKNGHIKIEDEKVRELLGSVESLESRLESYEKDVHEIKSGE